MHSKGTYLIGVGRGDPGSLAQDAARIIERAHTLIADAGTESACSTCLSQRRIRVDPNDRQSVLSARAELVSATALGYTVARVRLGDGWSDTSAVRDARALADRGLSFDVISGTSAFCTGWKAWFEERPLAGRTVAITRPQAQAETTATLLRERGAVPLVTPTIETRRPTDMEPFDSALRKLRSYGTVIFTSANGVEQTFAALRERERDARAFGDAHVAAIGPATAGALAKHGITADVVPNEYRAEGLIRPILDRCSGPALLLRAAEAREVLPEALQAAGWRVDVVAAYETVPASRSLEALARDLGAGEVDVLLVTSGSTVRHLCDGLGAAYLSLLSRTLVASIGPITTETAQGLGVAVGVTAEEYTLKGLVRALEDHFRVDRRSSDPRGGDPT